MTEGYITKALLAGRLHNYSVSNFGVLVGSFRGVVAPSLRSLSCAAYDFSSLSFLKMTEATRTRSETPLSHLGCPPIVGRPLGAGGRMSQCCTFSFRLIFFHMKTIRFLLCRSLPESIERDQPPAWCARNGCVVSGRTPKASIE